MLVTIRLSHRGVEGLAKNCFWPAVFFVITERLVVAYSCVCARACVCLILLTAFEKDDNFDNHAS